jgi:membrane-associated phospholipid phosphatase
MKFLFLLFISIPFVNIAQNDSLSKRYEKINWLEYNLNTKKKTLWHKSITPAMLGITSLLLNNKTTKQKLQLQAQKPFNGYTTSLDDYIQFAPIGIMYGADLFKLKAEHSVWNQSKFLFMSNALTGLIVLGLKHVTHIERPDGSSFTSYPSGHTAQAFVTSQVLYNEFNNTNKLLAYSGYIFSISTGTLRVVNNRHWIPDVLLGAGIGILVTNLIYHFEPLKGWTPKFLKKQTDVSFQFNPIFNDQYVGANFKLNL